jgi:DNA-directed RNA polymerase specialized sigma24 family protein
VAANPQPVTVEACLAAIELDDPGRAAAIRKVLGDDPDARRKPPPVTMIDPATDPEGARVQAEWIAEHRERTRQTYALGFYSGQEAPRRPPLPGEPEDHAEPSGAYEANDPGHASGWLDAHGKGHRLLSPRAAYRGLRGELRVAAAMVDATLWGSDTWLGDVLAAQAAETLTEDDPGARREAIREMIDVLGGDGSVLSDRQADTLARLIDGQSPEAIAYHTGRSWEAVRQMLVRTLRELREAIPEPRIRMRTATHVTEPQPTIERVTPPTLSDVTPWQPPRRLSPMAADTNDSRCRAPRQAAELERVLVGLSR